MRRQARKPVRQGTARTGRLLPVLRDNGPAARRLYGGNLARLAEPAIRVDGAAGFDGFQYERKQAFRGGVRDASMRIRPIPDPSSCAAMTINVFRPACRPRVPSS